MQRELQQRVAKEEVEELQTRLRTAETLLAAQTAADAAVGANPSGQQQSPFDLSHPKESLVSILQVPTLLAWP